MRQVKARTPSFSETNVGNTPCTQSTYFSASYNASVWIKNEAKNEPSETTKDRRNMALIKEYQDRDKVVFVQMTAGNSGLSLLELVRRFRKEHPEKDWKVVNIIDRHIEEGIKARLREHSDEYSIIIEHNKGRIISDDEMIAIAERSINRAEGYELIRVDSYEHTKLADGYRGIWQEITDSGIKPDIIFMPVGSGETLVSAAEFAFEQMGDRCPKFVGVTIPDNPIARGQIIVEGEHDSPEDKLDTPHSPFLGAIERLRQLGVVNITTAGPDEVERTFHQLTALGIEVERASATAFCGLAKYELSGKSIIVVNTGKGVYDEDTAKHFFMKKRMRFAGWVAAIAVAVLAFIGLHYSNCTTQGETTIVNTPFGSFEVKNLHTTAEQRRAYRAMSRAKDHADRNSNGNIDPEEFEEICDNVPTKQEQDCETDAREGRLTLADFTIPQLECYNGVISATKVGGPLGITMESQAQERCDMGGAHEKDRHTIREILGYDRAGTRRTKSR